MARRPAAIDVGPGRRLLDRLGVPAAYLEGLSGDDEPFELLRRALQRLPTCPPKPTGPGGVMVIVGERIWADDVAVGICRELSLRPEDIVVATQRRGRRGTQAFIDTAETAGYERRSWRWRKVPTVVIVESSVAPAGDPWATEVLTALEPTLCWGVAEASRKAEDVGEWSRRLGGFDALALVDLESTLSPAAALAIGLPISEIDGLVADADAWVHALAATVQAAGMWP